MIRSNDKNQMIYCIFRVQTHGKYFLLQSVIELQRRRHVLRDEDEKSFCRQKYALSLNVLNSIEIVIRDKKKTI